jgi:hypothetical protein
VEGGGSGTFFEMVNRNCVFVE